MSPLPSIELAVSVVPKRIAYEIETRNNQSQVGNSKFSANEKDNTTNLKLLRISVKLT